MPEVNQAPSPPPGQILEVSPDWQAKLRDLVPSYGTTLNGSPARVQQEWNATASTLQLTTPPTIDMTPPPAPPTGNVPQRKKEQTDADLAL